MDKGRIMTKARTGAQVPSRLADYLEYKPSNLLQLSGNSSIGSLSVDEAVCGSLFPSVQGAIDDIVTLTDPPIGTVMTNTTGLNPKAVSQVQTITITGTAAASAGDEAVVFVFGLPIKVSNGDNDEAITGKVFSLLEKYHDDGHLFTNVQRTTGAANKIDVSMIDYKNHPVYKSVNDGVTVTTSVSTPAQSGVIGSWTQLGKETKFTKTLTYWERIG